MNTVSALSPNARRLFPLLDPTVGRAVGAYLQYQKNEGKPEALKLEGKLDDGDPQTPDKVSLSLSRHQDGTVQVTGTYAGVPVNVGVQKDVRSPFRPKDNLIFGQAGRSTETSDAVLTGKVGDEDLYGMVSTRRQAVALDMTPELEAQGKSIYVLPFTLAVTPTFGGAPALVNGLPGDAPTNSRPLATTDHTVIEARLGLTQIARDQAWVTTTWTTSTNLRDGGSRVEMKQAEQASERERSQEGDGSVIGHDRHFMIDSGRTAQADDRAYTLDFAHGIIKANLKEANHQLELTLTPA